MMTTTINECNQFQNLVDSLTRVQMYIQPGTSCPIPSESYMPNARTVIREFLENTDIKLVEYAFTSGTARAHKLFRAEDGTIYQVYSSPARRDIRVFYLTRYLLGDLFEEGDMPDFEDPSFLSEPMSQSVEDTEIPSVEDTEIPSVEDTEIPSVEDTEIPSVEDTEIPSVEDTEIPSVEDTETQKLETLSKNLSAKQMYIPPDSVCAMPSEPYLPHARNVIREFLNNPELDIVEYGQSSGGARLHKLFRATNGVVYQVFVTTDRGARLYFLTRYLLRDYFSEDDMPEFEDPVEIQDL